MAIDTRPKDQPSGDDWRLRSARHLAGLKLHRQPYQRWSETWDHDHCAACGAKFAEFAAPDIQHVGYATGADYKHGARYAWVCQACFADLKDRLGWTSDEGGSPA